MTGPGVPDLGRIVQQAQEGVANPWGVAVTINTPEGAKSVPASLGVFLMLDAIASSLQTIVGQLEILAARDLSK